MEVYIQKRWHKHTRARRRKLITDFRSDVNGIVTRQDLARFLLKASKDFEINGKSWENQDITSFLEAMSAWVDDMDGFYLANGLEFNSDQDQPWKVFADIVCGGMMYE